MMDIKIREKNKAYLYKGWKNSFLLLTISSMRKINFRELTQLSPTEDAMALQLIIVTSHSVCCPKIKKKKAGKL